MTPPDRTTPAPARGWYGAGGVLAAAAGVGAGQLTAALVSPPASPVLAVGSKVVDATPTPLKEWGVATLGTADKPVLIAVVTVVALTVSAAIGMLARRHRTLGLALLAVLAGSTAVAAMTREAAAPVDLLPGAVTALVGVLAAGWFFGLLDRWSTARGLPDGAEPARRHVLAAGAGLGAVAVAGSGLGTLLSRHPSQTAAITLPRAGEPLPPLPAGLEKTVPDISTFQTSTKVFYRVDTAFVIPRVDPGDWRLTFSGMVDHPYQLTFDEILAMPLVEADITLMCVSNPVGGPYVGGARWLGVRTRDLLKRAGIQDGVDEILSTSTDGMTIATPVQALTDDRDSLLAIGMNGEPLLPDHGFPARLVVPGLYGYNSATKWVTDLKATTYARDTGYWNERGWATDAPVLTESRIDTPFPGTSLAPGTIPIGGVAWAQHRGITKVEVQVDDGPWQEATLGPDAGIDYWRQWYLRWDATPGNHRLRVRATDATGTTQTPTEADNFPSGATGWHTIPVTISA